MGRSRSIPETAARAWLFRGPTIGQRLEDANGRASGFDYLRLSLALLILFFHSFAQQEPEAPIAHYFLEWPGRAIRNILVPMFFGLGGFLVAGSLERTKSLITYWSLRSLRIFPALWADILFSALVLGPLMTTLPLAVYFSSPEFRVYFLNLLGDIHYYLPGVFKGNPKQHVNGQLWTVPWDLFGYILLSALTYLRIYKNRRHLLVAVVAMQVLFPVAYLLARHFFEYKVASFHLIVVPCFMAGVLVHAYRDRIVWSWRIFSLCLLIITASLLIHPHSILYLTFPIIYVTVFLGLFNPKRTWVINSGDYSYGIFLYHRAIQQALWVLIPFGKTWYGNLLLSAPISLCFAFMSWHLVEKIALAQKSRITRLDDWFATIAPPLRVAPPRVASTGAGSGDRGRHVAPDHAPP